MTSGEKMVWAAAFLKSFDLRLNENHFRDPSKKAALATVDAMHTVKSLREAEDYIIKSWGIDSEVYSMYCQMFDK